MQKRDEPSKKSEDDSSDDSSDSSQNEIVYLHQDIVINSDKQNSAQGSVFYVKLQEHIDKGLDRELVLKIYKQKDLKSYFKEKAVLNHLEDYRRKNQINGAKDEDITGFGFPEVVSKIETNKQAEILMQALGPNLRKLIKQCPGKQFSKLTVYMITIQLIQRIRVLHEMGYVHNDLKLDNILIGYKDPSMIYLIDFGLTCRYLNDDGSHIEKVYTQKFSGNFLFASLNSCRGNNKSRRDDIQSLMYIMIYLLNKSYLPWGDFHKKFEDTSYEFKDFLRERLDLKYTKEVFKLIPRSLREMLKKILTLQFEEEPQYDVIIEKITAEIQKLVKIGPDLQPIKHQFEWAQTHAQKIKANILKENLQFENSEQQNQSHGSMSKILMMNFRSKNIGMQNDSNLGSIQSHALRNFNGRASSNNLSNYQCDSQNNSLLVLDGDDSRNSRENNNSWSKIGSGSIGQINDQIHIQEQRQISQGGLPPRVHSGGEEFLNNSDGPPRGERQRSSSNRNGAMSFFGQQQKLKLVKKSQFAGNSGGNSQPEEELKFNLANLNPLQGGNNNSRFSAEEKKMPDSSPNPKVPPKHQFRKNESGANEESDASSDESKKVKDDLSDYIDENFDLDETDELWGIQRQLNNCHMLQPNQNDIAQIDKKCTNKK